MLVVGLPEQSADVDALGLGELARRLSSSFFVE
jgi:hypothetical protein